MTRFSSVDFLFCDKDIFKDDNARIHLAQFVKEWFKQNETHFHTWFDDQCPEFNPIKKLCPGHTSQSDKQTNQGKSVTVSKLWCV